MWDSWSSGRLPRPVGTVGRVRIDSAARHLGPASRSMAPQGMPRGLEVGRGQESRAAARPPAGKTPRASSFDELITDIARREGVDEGLVKAVVEAESGFNPRAVSPAGAKGLMQLMDGTARSLGVKDSFDPVSNLAGGTQFLRSMLDRFGSVPLALAAYNAGPGAVEKYGGIPPYKETRGYVEKVLSLQRQNQLAAIADFKEGGGDGGRPIA